MTVFLCTAWVLTVGIVVYALIPNRADHCECTHPRSAHQPVCRRWLCKCVEFKQDWWLW